MFVFVLCNNIIENHFFTTEPEDGRRLEMIKQQLAAVSLSSNAIAPKSESATTTMRLSTREQLKIEYENMLAADCLMCGELMINSIDKPFINDWDQVNNDWL